MQSAAQPDEVVEVFTGDTLEEAMAYAVATLGPDLTVRRARRVRKGVQGLRGKDRYEVVAVPPPRAEGDAVEGAFAALLAQAEELEAPEPPRQATVLQLRPGPEPQLYDAEVEAPDLTPPPAPAPPPLVVAPRDTPKGAQRSNDHPRAQRIPAPRAARPAAKRATSQPVRRAVPAPRAAAPTGWSRQALAGLGLPKRLLAQLPEKDPRGDLAWARALERAFAALVPAPDPTAAVTVSGTGIPGVLGILDAARKGLAVGTISYAGRTAPATASELALAVRSELLG